MTGEIDASAYVGGMLGGMENISEPQQGKIEKCNVTGGNVSARNGRCGGILGCIDRLDGSTVNIDAPKVHTKK